VKSELDVKVYYEDTDSLGVVYHANYLRYFERGRTEMINELGRGIEAWNADGFNFAVVKMTINFHKPARLNDRCTVVTTVLSCGEFRMRLDQRLFRGEDLLTGAKVDLVCLDANLELRELPPEVAGLVDG
jgi:tol-pal system-associated acyl-CoA thioesterase